MLYADSFEVLISGTEDDFNSTETELGFQSTGVINSIEIWRNIPKYRFLYYFFKIKLSFLLLYLLYEIVAYFLFLKNKSMLKKNE